MPNSPIGHAPSAGDKPPDPRPHGVVGKRLRGLFVLASTAAVTVAVGVALIVAAQPAQAVSVVDGQWTVSHGGTGQVSLNRDGTYTSTCQVNSAYADAWCPASSGTFQYSTMGTASVTFNGADGSSDSYRVSGDVYSPDTITSTFGSRTYSPLVMKKGSHFVCTDWSGTGTSFTRWGISPELEYDAAADMLYATGSHDRVGPKNIDTQVNLAETAPNYFQNGSCDSLPPATSTPAPPTTSTPAPAAHHIGDLDNAATVSSRQSWQPKVTATVLDSTGAAVAGATVSGTFSHHSGTLTCTTAANGTCTLGNFSFKMVTKSTSFKVTGVAKSSSTYMPSANSDPDGDSNGTSITVKRP